MALVLSSDAQLVRDTAQQFFQEKAPIAALRKLRDTNDPVGFSPELWHEMAALGWAGFLVPEAYGGSEFGLVGLGLVLEQAGHTLAATPLISTALIGASALVLGGSEAQKREYLPGLVSGEQIIALALEEGPHHAPHRISVKAETVPGGYRLSGEKRFVLDGHVADMLIVPARDQAGEIQLLLVPGEAGGVTRTRTIMVDSRNAANIRFDAVTVGADAVLSGGPKLLDQVLDRARAGLAAEMLGSSTEAFGRIVQYLKERKQFGVLIGTFQALKHRAAAMFCELELTRSAVLAALSAVDDGSDEAASLASLAKAKASETFFLVSNEGIQMHGGIGMTDEHEIGFFLKRARVAQASFGDASFQRDRYAMLAGF
jgi:alkylation response protein AidB-like acyl-CoA dehydrogenase